MGGYQSCGGEEACQSYGGEAGQSYGRGSQCPLRDLESRSDCAISQCSWNDEEGIQSCGGRLAHCGPTTYGL